MKTYKLCSPRSGRPVPNQVVVSEDDGTRTFQSYGSSICKVDANGHITLDNRYWDYSVTTRKYRNIFLGLPADTLKLGIMSGSIKFANLNERGQT